MRLVMILLDAFLSKKVSKISSAMPVFFCFAYSCEKLAHSQIEKQVTMKYSKISMF